MTHETLSHHESPIMQVAHSVARVMDRWEATHKDSVYATRMQWFKTIREQHPDRMKDAPGMQWDAFDTRITGVLAEAGCRFGDFVFTAIAWPVALWKHGWLRPLQTTTASNYKMADFVVERFDSQGNKTESVNMRITPSGFTHIV